MKDDHRNVRRGPLRTSQAGDKKKVLVTHDPDGSLSKMQFQRPLGDITQEEMLRFSAEILPLFPPPPQGTELVLMEIDPYRMHAYWHVDADDLTHALREAGSPYAPLVVRMQEATKDEQAEARASSAFDVDIEDNETHRYVTVSRCGQSYEAELAYEAELGVRKADGTLVHLARSERVHLPRAGQAHVYNVTALDTSILRERVAAQTELAPVLFSQSPVDIRAERPLDEPVDPEQEKKIFPVPARLSTRIRNAEPWVTNPPNQSTAVEAPASRPSCTVPFAGPPVREPSWESSAFPFESTSSFTVLGSEQ